ncbi:MAG: Na+:solute symporter [Acidobacteria bacterium]|nr:Na+:solute symporter [Acidobacteriota bacterium]
MQLHTIDWIIAFFCIAICFVPALFFGKRSGKSTAEFFASGRSVPWWLAGISMVATTFSSDTPNLVANFVRTQGVAGNWQWWAFTMTGVSTVFFYARLWRRSGVLTDLEFYELRYSGKAASAVRGFRAVYLGFFFNCIIMATVNLAACKIAAVLFGLDRWQTLLAVGILNVVFATHSGLWGVLVIDMVQFFIKMSAVIAAAYFAVTLPQVGGLSGLVTKLSHLHGPGNVNYLAMLPDFTNNWDLAVGVFVLPVTVLWWSVWYPGAEPGGGSYIAQRMLASKSERDALGGTLFFNVAHYVLRPWPWILVGLASIVVYPELSDIHRAFPNVPPALIGHDIAFPAMLRFLPAGWVGLMVGGLVAANSSTILTHLNWGASYLVHDFYRRFVRNDAEERHYVVAGRVATVILFVCSSGMVFLLDTAKDSFNLLLQVGAGTGLLYLVRWFWHRVTAWCEIAAMISSFGISVLFLVLKKNGIDVGNTQQLIITIAVTTVCWVATAYLGPQNDPETMQRFFEKVHPGTEDFRGALVGWVAGCLMIWSALFAVGNVLYGRLGYALALTLLFAISGTVVIRTVKKLWKSDDTATEHA